MIDVKKADWDCVISALKKDENNPIIEINATEIISPNRLDIIVREMALVELIQGIDGIGLDVYHRWLQLSHGIKEATKTDPLTSYFSEYSEKNGFESYCSSFLKLYESIKNNGFDENKFLPLDGEGNPINGAHRLAVALYLGLNVFIKTYANVKTGWKWNCNRLSAKFSDAEILLILQNYVQHKKNCFCISAPCKSERTMSDECDFVIQKLRSVCSEIGKVYISKSNGLLNDETNKYFHIESNLDGYMLWFFQCTDDVSNTVKNEIILSGMKMIAVN